MQTVLIVDSDPLERNWVLQELVEAGYEVLEAATWLEAVGLVREEEDVQVIVFPEPVAGEAGDSVGALTSRALILVTVARSGETLTPTVSQQPSRSIALIRCSMGDLLRKIGQVVTNDMTRSGAGELDRGVAENADQRNNG